MVIFHTQIGYFKFLALEHLYVTALTLTAYEHVAVHLELFFAGVAAPPNGNMFDFQRRSVQGGIFDTEFEAKSEGIGHHIGEFSYAHAHSVYAGIPIGAHTLLELFDDCLGNGQFVHRTPPPKLSARVVCPQADGSDTSGMSRYHETTSYRFASASAVEKTSTSRE
jgi:hypothetical protein